MQPVRGVPNPWEADGRNPIEGKAHTATGRSHTTDTTYWPAGARPGSVRIVVTREVGARPRRTSRRRPSRRRPRPVAHARWSLFSIVVASTPLALPASRAQAHLAIDVGAERRAGNLAMDHCRTPPIWSDSIAAASTIAAPAGRTSAGLGCAAPQLSCPREGIRPRPRARPFSGHASAIGAAPASHAPHHRGRCMLSAAALGFTLPAFLDDDPPRPHEHRRPACSIEPCGGTWCDRHPRDHLGPCPPSRCSASRPVCSYSRQQQDERAATRDAMHGSTVTASSCRASSGSLTIDRVGVTVNPPASSSFHSTSLTTTRHCVYAHRGLLISSPRSFPPPRSAGFRGPVDRSLDRSIITAACCIRLYTDRVESMH